MKKIADERTSEHYEKLLKENQRLHERIVTLEVEIDSLKSKNAAIMNEIDKRAHGLYLAQIARIKQISDQAVSDHEIGQQDHGSHT